MKHIRSNGATWNRQKIGLITLVMVLVACIVLSICWYCAVPRTKIKDAAEARAVFETCFEGADGILYPYNMTTDSSIADDLGKASRDMTASVAIDELRMLTIRLAYTSGQVPTYELVLTRSSVFELSYCYTDLEEYTYLFEIASLFSGNRSAGSFKSSMNKMIDRTKRMIEKNGFDTLYHQKETLRSFFQETGVMEYSITENKDGSGYEVELRMTGLLAMK